MLREAPYFVLLRFLRGKRIVYKTAPVAVDRSASGFCWPRGFTGLRTPALGSGGRSLARPSTGKIYFRLWCKINVRPPVLGGRINQFSETERRLDVARKYDTLYYT